jgi:hypothetical protein
MMIDEPLRLHIAEQLAGHFKGDIIGPDHAEPDMSKWVTQLAFRLVD